MPLWWNETKSANFFEALLKNYQAHQVVDMSAGLALASAAMRLNVRYAGVALNNEHSTWLQNSIDKAAIAVICDNEHSLYQESLSGMLSKLFPGQCEYKEVTQDESGPVPATPPGAEPAETTTRTSVTQ